MNDTNVTDSGSVGWFTPVGIILIVLGFGVIIKFTRKQNKLRDTGVEVMATIISIEKDLSSMSEYGNNIKSVYISYTIDRKEYRNILDQPTSGKIGDKVKIYADIKNPNDFASAGKSPQIAGLITVIVGIVLIILGITFS
ncbi:MAG: DUF3592 domain-containing protein [Oscillospiraceae bacterium]|jgi:uncharacterized membrane protein|nr:DUF3592 domain-containing protein [Oscillospiraceae bacterium]